MAFDAVAEEDGGYLFGEREIDLAGNIVHETNTGIIANQLMALGYTDGTPCDHTIKAISACAANPSFRNSILPGRPYLDVLDSQRSLFQAELTLAQARNNEFTH